MWLRNAKVIKKEKRYMLIRDTINNRIKIHCWRHGKVFQVQ